MKEYQRTTKECKFNDFPPETVQAFRKYFEKQDLGNIESEILMAGETVSTRLKTGFFAKLFGGRNFAHRTAIFFTRERLFWCTTDRQNERTVLSAKLREIEVKDFSSDLVEDSGIQVFGFINQSPERVQAFVGLGEEPFALEFKNRLKEAVQSLVS